MQEENRAGRLVAVVVTHNRLDKLQVTLEQLLAPPSAQLEGLIVVDNASSDGTGDWLAGLSDPRVCVARLTKNRGGAGGFEHGVRLACDRFDPDWILLTDDDGRPAPGALAAFHGVPRPDDVAVAAAVYYPDGRVCEMNRPSVNPFWRPGVFARTLVNTLLGRGRDGYHIPYTAYDAGSVTAIDLTSFVGLFLSRRMVKTNGLPDGTLFLYGDDVIYTLRLRRHGFAISFDPHVRFEHDCSTFETDRKRVFRPLWKVYYTYRNGLIMYREAAGLLFWPLAAAAAVKWAFAGQRYGVDRPGYNRLLRRALVDALRNRTDMTHEEVIAMADGPA